MNEFKGTPGPWEVRPKGLLIGDMDHHTFVGQVGSGLVARTFINKLNSTDAESCAIARADARLISASPELLAACQMAIEDCQCPIKCDGSHADCPCWYCQTCAAIKKATEG